MKGSKSSFIILILLVLFFSACERKEEQLSSDNEKIEPNSKTTAVNSETSPKKEEQLFLNSGVMWYQGEVKNGKPHGIGRNFGSSYYYEGEWKDGVPNGKGQIKTMDGDIKFEGTVQNPPDQIETIFRARSSNNGLYTQYLYYAKWGEGTIYWAQSNGRNDTVVKQYEGPINKAGHAVKYYYNGQVEYEGDVNEDFERHGYGKSYDLDGNLIFEGQWEFDNAIIETDLSKYTNSPSPVDTTQDVSINQFEGDWTSDVIEDSMSIKFNSDGKTGTISSGDFSYEFEVYEQEGNLLSIVAINHEEEESPITEFYLEDGRLIETGEMGVIEYTRN